MTTDPQWRKSTFTGQNGSCVEVAEVNDAVLLRNSNHPDAGTLTVEREAMAGLLAEVRLGGFDHHA